MKNWKKAFASRGARLALAGSVIVGLAAPALASHFDFAEPPDDVAAAATAESFDVACAAEGTALTGEEQAACDEVVAGVAQDLVDYEHPENHGKYVSFLARCLKGVKGKGEMMRQVAGDDSDGGAADLAVKLCAEAKLTAGREASEEETEVRAKGKGKARGDDGEEPEAVETHDPDGDVADSDETEDETEPSDEDSGPGRGKSRSSGGGSSGGKGGGKPNGRW